MTVCGPSNIGILLSFVLPLAIPILIIYLIHKKWKTQNRIIFWVIYIVIFIVIGLITWTLIIALTSKCSYSIGCLPFKYYQNSTCTIGYGNNLVYGEECLNLKKGYDSQQGFWSKKDCPVGSIARYGT